MNWTVGRATFAPAHTFAEGDAGTSRARRDALKYLQSGGRAYGTWV
jgi:hypothetical protein